MSLRSPRFAPVTLACFASILAACDDGDGTGTGGAGGTGSTVSASTSVGTGSVGTGSVGSSGGTTSTASGGGAGGAATSSSSGGEGGAGAGGQGQGGDAAGGASGTGGDPTETGNGGAGGASGGAGPGTGGSGSGGDASGSGGAGGDASGSGGAGGAGSGGAGTSSAASTSGAGGRGGAGGGGSFCGDGIIDEGEACDDGDDVTGDGCHLCREVVEIAAGRDHACARFSDGRVKCWGSNDWGQIGAPSDVVGDEPGEIEEQPDVDLGTGAFAVSLALGDDHSCALLATGEVKCWGANQFGQLGVGDSFARGDDPGEMGDALPAVNLGNYEAERLFSGANFACVLTPTNRVRCWGGNSAGQLGLGHTMNVGTTEQQLETLTVIGLDEPVVDLALGRAHACALGASGAVFCWGENGAGQLGWGGTEDRGDAPGEIDDLAIVAFGDTLVPVDVSAGESTSCARFDDGSTRCWGSLFRGKTLSGRSTSWGDQPGEAGAEAPLADVGQQESITSLAVSFDHGCFLTDSQRLKCGGRADLVGLEVDFGNNVAAEPDEIGDALPFVDVGTDADVLGLAVGRDFSCALREGGTVVCWGENQLGQLGRGSTAPIGNEGEGMGDALVPVAIP